MNQRVDLIYNCEAVVEFQIVLLRLERKLSLPHVQDPAGANVFQGPSHVIGFLSPEPCTLASQRFMGVILCASTPSWVLPIWVGVFESYGLFLYLWAHLPRLVAPRGWNGLR